MRSFYSPSPASNDSRNIQAWRSVDRVLIVASCFLTLGSCALWWLRYWYFFPTWVPLPGPAIMGFLNFLDPIIFFFVGIPLLIVYPGIVLIQFARAVQQLLRRQILRVLHSGIILIVLGALPLLWWLGPSIDVRLLQQTRAYYDQVTKHVEQYKRDKGEYPTSLSDLVPAYLPAEPTITVKYGESLRYEPTPSAWFDHAPFTFELYGHYGVHGQTLKFCPIDAEPCYETDRHFSYRRIDDRWIWLYSSAL